MTQEHPYLIALVTAVAGWATPTPTSLLRALAATLKGLTMLNPEQIQTAVKDVQQLVKLALEYVPGDSSDAKSAAIVEKVRPLFDEAIGPLGLPGPAVSFANTVLEWMIAAEVKAAENA